MEHTSNLNVMGDVNAPVLVVCDATGEQAYAEGRVMPNMAMDLFGVTARENGFAVSDFLFVTASPPLPPEAEGSARREAEYIAQFRDELWTVINQSQAQVIVYLGALAGRQVMGRPVQIMRGRGQVLRPENVNKPVLPLLSPTFVLRRPELREIFNTDFSILRRLRDHNWSTAELDTSTRQAVYEWRTDISDLVANPPVALALDTETIGFEWFRGSRLLTVQMTWQEGHSIVLPVNLAYWEQYTNGDAFWAHIGRLNEGRTEPISQENIQEEWIEWCRRYPRMDANQLEILKGQIRELLANPRVHVAGHNLKFDVHQLRQENITIANWFADTMQLAFAIDENMQEKSLDECTRRWIPEMAGYADCVIPSTQVLTADMRKVPAGSLKVGDVLCAFTAETNGKKAGRRRMKKSIVQGVQRLMRPCLKITTRSGRQTTVSVGHLFLSKRGNHDKGGGWRWRRADDLVVGSVLKPFPWENPVENFDAGYVSGVIDGEGWNCKAASRVGVAQRNNVVLGKFREVVSQYGILEGHSTDKRKSVHVVNVTFDGQECFKLLQKFRPLRLLNEAKWEGCGLPTNGHRHDEVVSVEWAGELEVVGLQTSTQTIIADGLCSHNSFNRRWDKSRMDLVPPDDLLPYAGGDTDAAFRLARLLYAELRRDSRQQKTFENIQMPSLRTFVDMERRGVGIDQQALADLAVELETRENSTYEALIENTPATIRQNHLDAGLKFSRAAFVQDILFTPQGFNLRPLVFTKGSARSEAPIPSVSAKTHLPFHLAFRTGTWGTEQGFQNFIQGLQRKREAEQKPLMTDVEIGTERRAGFPYVEKLIEYSKLQKLRSTYVGHPAGTREGARGRVLAVEATGFWQYIAPDGRIHPSFFLHDTVTGRSSSRNPNAQNFPKRGEMAKAFRKVFRPTPGYVFVECDLSQAELRIAAWMAMEPTMLEVYAQNGDIHTATAAAVLGMSVEQFLAMPEDQVKLYRFYAKAVNFGFLYGMGWRKFKNYAKTEYGVDFTDERAEELRNVFFRTYPRLADWHAAMREFTRRHAYVRSLHGALRHLPSINSPDEAIKGEAERQGINSPVQRFASDLGLMAMSRLGRDTDWDLVRPLLFIHDALVCEVREDVAEQGAAWIKYYMESNPLQAWFGLTSPIPLLADVSIGNNLGEMRERKDIAAAMAPFYNPLGDV